MRKIALALAILGTTLSTAPYTAPAHAQASRTWVSGVGDDANPCSRTAPCKTFAGAISKTAAGGEIDALDPAGYGAVTITKAITIDGGGGQVASVLVSGTNGIVVQAGPSDVVILRNLRINGIGTGINGIRFLAGAALVVDTCDIFGFTVNGVDVARAATGTVLVRDSTFNNINGNGVNATTTAGSVFALVSHSSFGGKPALSGGGVAASTNAIVAVRDSVFNGLSLGAGATNNGNLTVDNSYFNLNSTGISGQAGTTVNANNNTLSNNTAAFSVAGSSSSAGNNKVVGNLGTFNPSAMLQK
jgi:hypothetical protein